MVGLERGQILHSDAVILNRNKRPTGQGPSFIDTENVFAVDGRQPLYMIDSFVSANDSSWVYKAKDLTNKDYVAIKISKAGVYATKGTSDILELEAKTMAKLRRCRGVVYVRNLLRMGDGNRAIVMDFIEYPTLEDKINHLFSVESPIEDAELIKVVKEVSKTSEYMARFDLFHTDLKPGNIYLDPTYTLISDFGISTWVLQDRSMVPGESIYMAPEIIVSKGKVKPNLRSEEFVIAEIAYQMLTNDLIFKLRNKAGPEKVIRAMEEFSYLQLRDFASLEKRLGPRRAILVDNVLGKVLEKNPQKRYPGPVEFSKALEKAILST